MLLSVAALTAQTNGREIVNRSVQVSAAHWNAAPDYECFERDRESGYDYRKIPPNQDSFLSK
jgi:hypothetical protein